MGKMEEGIDILIKAGIPSPQQNERSSLTLLAVVDLQENAPWTEARKRIIRIHDILVFIQKYYKRRYAENTRETIRRQTLHQFEQAGIVERNADDPSRPTNSPKTVYNITNEALELVKAYGAGEWEKTLHNFITKKGRLIDKYDRRKSAYLLELKSSKETILKFSPGKHNELQIKIVQDFIPRFCSEAELVYIGDTARKLLFQNMELLQKLNIPLTRDDKLPDVILYDEAKKHLLLIEAVTSHGPVSAKRYVELEQILKGCNAVRIYISAFPDFREFKRHIDNIAWETEVWIADRPDHMIHFNGPKFFSAY